MYEVEQKYRIENVDVLAKRLLRELAREQPVQRHSDTYFNHPSRDFGATREALRIRRVDGIPMVTYKGTKLPGAVKARQELEWRLDPGDADGSKTQELWLLLGFRQVATVLKVRRSFQLDGPWSDLSVVVDDVDQLGQFAEVEAIVSTADDVEMARSRVESLATELGLHSPEPRSYLRMLLEMTGNTSINA